MADGTNYQGSHTDTPLPPSHTYKMFKVIRGVAIPPNIQ